MLGGFGLLVRSFSTSSRPACGRPPAAAVLGRQHHTGNRGMGLTQHSGLVAAATPEARRPLVRLAGRIFYHLKLRPHLMKRVEQ